MANILLMEDYPSLQRIFSTILRSRNHTVHVASNGHEGLVLAGEHPIDLILVDILMPIMGGIEFLQEFNLKNHPDTKAIALTNIYDDDLVKQTKRLGVSDYIIKSDIRPNDIIEIVDKHTSQVSPA